MKKVIDIERKSAFIKGFKQLQKDHQNKIINKLKTIIEELVEYKVTTQYRNHTLSNGNYELHVDGDVQLTYVYRDNRLVLVLLDLSNHKQQNNPRHQKHLKTTLTSSLDEEYDEFDRQWDMKFGHTVGKRMTIEEFHKLMKEMSDFKVNEDIQPRKINISKIPLTTFKKLAVTSNKVSSEQAKDFRFATDTEPLAEIINETDKAYLINIIYYRWNKDRTGKDKSSILIWYPKSNLKRNFYLGVRENKGANLKINSRGIRESLERNEYFTKEEIKTLPNELAKYFQDQPVPKYYDISVEDMGDKKYVLRGNIDYGDVSHDHRYFDAKAKEFFNDKGISVDIYEPDDLRDNDYGDDIYSSAHIIQKSGNRVYVPQENELDNFID